MKDVKFPAQSVMYGWSTAGAFPKVDNGTAITATARSFSGNLLCAGDNFGNVKMFRWPCWSLGAASHEFRGHASPIADLVFTNEVRSPVHVHLSLLTCYYHMVNANVCLIYSNAYLGTPRILT